MWGWGQNTYGGHQIGCISTIFSCNYIHFQQETKCGVERCGPKVHPESPICIHGSVKEWTHTLPSGLPLWELESLWSFKPFMRYFKGQNLLDQKVPYTIQTFLKFRCLKWVRMTHLSIQNTLWPKERPRIKMSIWLLPIKSQESPCNKCVQVACYISLEISQ